jgi:hypothetical protein
MLKGLPIAQKAVLDGALVEDADPAPYLLPCNTPEFYNNDEDVPCDKAKG